MLNWIPALFLLLMHGAAAPETAARDARLPLGAVAIVQSAAQAKAQGPSLAAALRLIVRLAAQASLEAGRQPVERVGDRLAVAPPADQALPEDAVLPSSRTRDGPSVA